MGSSRFGADNDWGVFPIHFSSAVLSDEGISKYQFGCVFHQGCEQVYGVDW